MKEIYKEIISQGATGVADECGENKKGENLALVAQIEMENQLKLFPEMLSALKHFEEWLNAITNSNPEIEEEIKEVLSNIIKKAEGGK
tara:strand:- start:12 stop:275 length:264 start_codon:yes stop_codon:yes gene_type:complete